MRKLLLVPAVMVGLVTLPATQAEAVEYGFYCVTNNGGCSILESQITVEIADGGSGSVDFTFDNSGPTASSITDVYFNDASANPANGSNPDSTIGDFFDWTSMSLSDSGSGVSFSTDCTPGDPPGANGFTDPAGACADAQSPVASNGVNPGESLTVNVELLAGQTFAELIEAIDEGLFSVGLHVQAIGTQSVSEAGLLDDGDTDGDGGGDDVIVAEPASLLLLGSGLLVAGARLRRRNT